MDVKDLVAQAAEEFEAEKAELTAAEAEPSDEEKSQEIAPEEYHDWVERMMREHPSEVVSPNEFFGEQMLLPGFEEFTLGLAAVYGMKWGTLAYYLEWKEKAYQPHLVDTKLGLHVVRGFSRREWSTFQKKLMSNIKTRMERHIEEDSDPQWAKQDIEAYTEEEIVEQGCVDPSYNKQEIRSLPTGLVSFLANCIMAASGHDQNPLPPMPLK